MFGANFSVEDCTLRVLRDHATRNCADSTRNTDDAELRSAYLRQPMPVRSFHLRACADLLKWAIKKIGAACPAMWRGICARRIRATMED